MPLLERFVVLLYHQASNCVDVNSCRRELFCKGRAIDNIHPTKEALYQNVRYDMILLVFIGIQCMLMINLINRVLPN